MFHQSQLYNRYFWCLGHTVKRELTLFGLVKSLVKINYVHNCCNHYVYIANSIHQNDIFMSFSIMNLSHNFTYLSNIRIKKIFCKSSTQNILY